mgnify:CR=1 FL=1
MAVGDTLINAENPAAEPLPGYKKVQSVVFCGIYPLDGSKFNDLKDAILKLQLNDASLIFEPDSLNNGFFHMFNLGHRRQVRRVVHKNNLAVGLHHFIAYRRRGSY